MNPLSSNTPDATPTVHTTTVPDPQHPTVVRRRVVIEMTSSRPALAASASSDSADADESPPSSIFAHPDYNIGADDDEDDDDVPSSMLLDVGDSAAEPPVSVRPIVHVGERTSIGAAAKQLGVSPAEVAAELVSRGLFAVTPRTILTPVAEGALEDGFHCRLVKDDETSG